MQHKVSVIVPVYNPGQYLIQCLESLVNQTMDPQDLQIILVNDGSTDGSNDILINYDQRFENILLIQKENGGYGSAMNKGLDAADGEYIGIVEPDDYVDVHMFEDLYKAACNYDSHPQIVKSAYWRVMRDGTRKVYIYPSPHKGRMHPGKQPFTIEDAGEILYVHPSIWSAIYRRDFLEEQGIRFKEIPGAGWADNPFFIQTLALAQSIIYVDECYYYYREDMIDGSARLKDYTIPFDRWNEMQDFIDQQGITSPVVLDAHACRGMSYIIGGERALNANEHQEDIKHRKEAMYRRMDKDAVLASERITVKGKKAYLAVVDPEYSGKLSSNFYKRLPGLFFQTVRGGGLGVATYRVRAFFSKKR